MKYTPLYNLIIRGYHKSWVIIRVSIYKPRGVALTSARAHPFAPTSAQRVFLPCCLPTSFLFVRLFSRYSRSSWRCWARPRKSPSCAFSTYVCVCVRARLWASHTRLFMVQRAGPFAEIRPIGLIGLYGERASLSLSSSLSRAARMICCRTVCPHLWQKCWSDGRIGTAALFHEELANEQVRSFSHNRTRRMRDETRINSVGINYLTLRNANEFIMRRERERRENE